MKERELKVLKFKNLFDSPTRERKDNLGGSFIVAQSARGAAIGRSVTKTSEEYRQMPLLDLIPGQTRNGGVKGDRTEKHQRLSSHFSSTVDLPAGDDLAQKQNANRRKTVGFKDSQRENGLSLSRRG